MMISAWHLLWIIPLAASGGLITMSLFVINRHESLLRDEELER